MSTPPAPFLSFALGAKEAEAEAEAEAEESPLPDAAPAPALALADGLSAECRNRSIVCFCCSLLLLARFGPVLFCLLAFSSSLCGQVTLNREVTIRSGGSKVSRVYRIKLHAHPLCQRFGALSVGLVVLQHKQIDPEHDGSTRAVSGTASHASQSKPRTAIAAATSGIQSANFEWYSLRVEAPCRQRTDSHCRGGGGRSGAKPGVMIMICVPKASRK
jgi:hypothetical protein